MVLHLIALVVAAAHAISHVAQLHFLDVTPPYPF